MPDWVKCYPSGEVNLFVSCTLANAIYIVRGDLTCAAAIDSQKLELIGDKWARVGFVDWLNLDPLTQVKSRRSAL